MLKIFYLLLILYTSLYGSIKTEIPKCITTFTVNYLKNDDFKAVLNRLKYAQEIDSSIPLSEVSAGFPLKVYRINYCILDTCSPDINVDELIIPTGEWLVPFYWKGKAIYEIMLRLRNGGCKNIGSSDMNKKYYSIYDHLSQIDIFKKDQFPIIIQNGTQQYVHFPKLNRKNLKIINYGRVETKDELDNIRKISDTSFEEFKKLQNEYRARKAESDSLVKARPELQHFFYNTKQEKNRLLTENSPEKCLFSVTGVIAVLFKSVDTQQSNTCLEKEIPARTHTRKHFPGMSRLLNFGRMTISYYTSKTKT